jgi:DNA polymerase-3 subunit epsilon
MQGNAMVHRSPFDPGFGSLTLIDVETSGLRAGDHRVLSVAALTLASDGSVAQEFTLWWIRGAIQGRFTSMG